MYIGRGAEERGDGTRDSDNGDLLQNTFPTRC